MLVDGLGVNHLRLVMGTSMGGMQTWLWGELHPDFMDALMPLASVPDADLRAQPRLASHGDRRDPQRSRLARRRLPQTQPQTSQTLADRDDLFHEQQRGRCARRRCRRSPTADAVHRQRRRRRSTRLDVNDLLYQVESSRDYDPAPGLGRIRAPLVAVNFADDLINPPELGILEREIARVPNGRAIVVPMGPATRGHGTHTIAAVWDRYLADLLAAAPGLPAGQGPAISAR